MRWLEMKPVAALGGLLAAAYAGSFRAGLVVLHPTPAYVESLPIKLFEYMASGLPFVCSDFPLWRTMLHESHCGILVDPLDVEAIADALHVLLTRPAQAEEMGRSGRALVERRYSWESEARTLLDLYRQVQNDVGRSAANADAVTSSR